ncbi:hypothetical protein ACF1YU_003117 [Escherichia coli]
MTEQIYSDHLKEYCKDSPILLVKESEDMVKMFFKIDKQIPDKYRWRFSDLKTFTKQASSKNTFQGLNKIYWTDQSCNIEAYTIMTWWRGNELVRSCLNGLNRREVIVPAIAARSLLELSTVFLLNANTLEKNFEKITFLPDTIVTSTDIENLIAKMIWGTRYHPKDELLTQTNIMAALKKLAKNPKAEDLMPTYEFLCDIAHPSFIGNTSYWSHIEAKNPDASERRLMSRSTDRQYNTEITDKTLWALAWSSTCIHNAFIIMRNAYTGLLNKI